MKELFLDVKGSFPLVMDVSASVSKKNVMLLLIIIFLIIASSILTFSFSVFVMQILLSFITVPFIIKKNYTTAKIYVFIFAISICFVFLIYLANQIAYGTPYYIGGSDDLAFEQKGFMVYYYGVYNPSELLGNVLDRYDNAPFFAVYMAILINFANLFDGFSTFMPRVANVYFLIWIVMILEYLIKKYTSFSNKEVNISVAVFALTPNIQYINSHVFRDSFNLMQIFLIVFLFDKLIDGKEYMKKIFFFGALIFLIYITYYTRKNSLIFAGIICLLVLIEKLKLKRMYAIMSFIPVLMINNFLGMIKFKYFVEYYTNLLIDTAGNGLSNYVFRQPLLPFGIVFRAFYALISPFPNFFNLFNTPNTILLDFIIFLIYCGVVVQILFIPFIIKRLLKLDWLVLSFLTSFLGVIVTTFTFRHVMLYYPFMVVLGIDGYMSMNQKAKKQVLFLWIITTVMLGLIYIVLKQVYAI